MDPLMDEGATVLTIKPKNKEDIQIGDIVLFEAHYSEYLIAHRVIEIGIDDVSLLLPRDTSFDLTIWRALKREND